MPGNADRRPWLIISAAEAQALLAAALTEPPPLAILGRTYDCLTLKVYCWPEQKASNFR